MAKSAKLIAKELTKLKEKKHYKQIDKGFFVKQPEIFGYVVEIDIFEDYPIFIIINENTEYKYDKKFIKIDKYSFIVYNVSNLESFINDLAKNTSTIVGYIEEVLQNVKEVDIQKDNGLPYGFYEDEEGNIKVDQMKANEVMKIFKGYAQMRSIRQVAKLMNSSYSVIRDILYDDRYEKMPVKIIPDSYLSKVYGIMRDNRKNKQGKIVDKFKKAQLSKNKIENTTRTTMTSDLFKKVNKVDQGEKAGKEK